MSSKVEDESQIISYLLGELREEEQTLLEERFLRDLEYREIIRSVEDDLIDDYVHGELSGRERKLFEEHFTLLPHRRQKLEFAKALTKSFTAFQAAPALGLEASLGEDDHRWWSSLLNPFRGGPTWAFSVSLAAAVLLIVIGGVWFTNVRRAERERVLAEQRKQQQVGSRPSPGTDQGTPGNEIAAQPGPALHPSPTENTNNVAGRKERVTDPVSVDRPSPQLSVATFILSPGMTRNTGEARTFIVPQGTQLIRLQPGLERGEAYRDYRAELRTASGDAVWKSDNMRARSNAAGQTITLSIPADVITSGKYELKLTGVKGREATEDIGYYYFSIQKK